MPPSQISIATSSVQRLLKEIRSYQQEQQGQEKRLADLQALPAENRDENWEFEVRQQTQAIGETKAIFKPLRQQLLTAMENLEGMIEYEDSKPSGGTGDEGTTEVILARETLAMAKDGDSEHAKLYLIEDE